MRFRMVGWFCRKFPDGLKAGSGWTDLCCELGKLLECGDAIGVELSLADHVGDLDPRDRCGSRMEGLEAHHWACNPLDEAVVLFQYIVEVLDLPDRDKASRR